MTEGNTTYRIGILMDNSLTILVQLDACRYDYISEKTTPFLHELKLKGIYGKLTPTFGFEPDAAYIAGLYPDEVNGGAQFWYHPDYSPFKFTKYFTKYLNWLPDLPELVLRKLIKTVTRIWCKAPNLSVSYIPLNLLHYFSFPIEYTIEHPNYCSKNSIFNLLRQQNKKWLFHEGPEYKVNLDSAISRIKNHLFPPVLFAFIHIADLDHAGHKYGPTSSEVKKVLKNIDDSLKTIHILLKERYDSLNFVLIGDHGMVEVEKTLDINDTLKKLPVRLEKDYLVFLDSTMARFWFFSDLARDLIIDCLNNIDSGHILKKEEINKYHLNYNHNYFGDLIYLANPGVLIFPNYYQNKYPVKGMHGYSPETIEQHSIMIISSGLIKKPSIIKPPIDMRRIFSTILNLMKIPIPSECNVHSIIDQKNINKTVMC